MIKRSIPAGHESNGDSRECQIPCPFGECKLGALLLAAGICD